MEPMLGGSPGDILKIWFYAAASVLLGSWSAPLLYNAGKALAEVSQSKNTNGPLEWLARVCQRTDFPKFFEVSLLVAAGVLFLPFIEWLRSGHGGSLLKALPQRPPIDGRGRRLMKSCRHAGIGFLVVTTLFLLLAGLLSLAGAIVWKNPGGSVFSFVWQGFAIALGLAVFQEILFRGFAMGIFLRSARPASAIAMAAVLFALVHFLHPPPGMNVVDPDASGVGFELLRAIAASFFQLHVFFGTFAPLLALGAVLAQARWSTASLGLPIGLHTGWIFVHGLLDDFTIRGKSIFWGISDASLRQGILPLAGLIFIGYLIRLFTTRRDATDAST